MVVLVFCSKGSRMASPKLGSAPAPPCPAAMIPPPAPVMTIQPAAAISWRIRRPVCNPVRFVGARAAENADLPHVTIGGEYLQGVAEFLEGLVDKLDVAAVGLIAQELHGVFDDLPDHVAVVDVA